MESVMINPADLTPAEILALAETLDDGAGADIWYDAADHAEEDAAHYEEGETLPGETIEQTQTAMTRAAEVLRALASSYIVLLMDVDGADWSPWPVVAASPAEAVEKARADWRESIEADDDEDPAEVVKVYLGTLSTRVDYVEETSPR